MKKSAVYDWIQCFRDGQDGNDDPVHGRHNETQTLSNVERVKQPLNSNRHLSIRDVADKLLIDRKTVCLIVKDELCLQKLCAKLVPKNITEEWKKRRDDVWCYWLRVGQNLVSKGFQIEIQNLREILEGVSYSSIL